MYCQVQNWALSCLGAATAGGLIGLRLREMLLILLGISLVNGCYWLFRLWKGNKELGGVR